MKHDHWDRGNRLKQLGLRYGVLLALWLALPVLVVAADFSSGRAKGMFKVMPQAQGGEGILERGIVWQRKGMVDLEALQTAAKGVDGKGQRIQFNIEAASQRWLRMQEFKPTGDGNWSAKGEVEGVFGSRALFVVRGRQFAGTVRVAGEGVYVLQGLVDGECQVRKLDPLKMPRCGVTDLNLQSEAMKRFEALKQTATDQTAVDEALGDGEALAVGREELAAGEIHPLDEPSVTIDMMVIYTAASRTGAGGRAAMETLIELAVLEANDCFANSLINLQLKLVHTQELVYTETGDMALDLQNLAFDGGGLDEVKNLRLLQFKADLVCLITEREDSGYIAGIAYVLQDPGGNASVPAFSVVRRAYAVGDYTFAHEVGHNLGCAHDRANSAVAGAYPYAYGHRFNALGITYATVMSYPPGVRIPYFSNPFVSYNGVPSGLPSSNPSSADNALAINQTAPVVSVYLNASRRYSFAQTTFNVNEGSPQATITVKRVGTSTSNMSVKYATSNGSAQAGQDYTATTGTLTFVSGQTNASFTVPLTNDTLAESPESFRVTLSDPQPLGFSGLGLDYQAQVVIKDNENGFHFELTDAVRSEAEPGFTLKVIREGSGAGAASVTVRPIAGTATAGTDFVGTDLIVSFAGGELEKTATVLFINDFVGETDQTFTVNLVNPTAGYVATQPSQVNVLLLDDDRPGAPDIAFNNGLGPNDNVFAAAVRPNGNVVVGGGFSQLGGLIRAGIAEFKADGSINSGFDPGIGVSGTVYALALRPDGRLILGGAFTAVNGVTRPNLAQLNVDGSLDLSFNPGLGPNATVRTLALAANDKVVIGGFFTSYAEQTRIYIARVNSTGALDSTFAPSAYPNLPVRAVAVQSDDKVIMGGEFTLIGSTLRRYVARLTSIGGLDTGFAASMDDAVRALAIMADGDVLVGGEFATANNSGYSYLARLNANGTTDTGFNIAARPNGFVRAIAVQSDQQILIGGDFTSIAGQTYGRVARLNPNGSVDASFQTGAGADAVVYALAIDPGKYAVVGGEFANFAGLPRSRVARVRVAPNVELFEPVIVPLTRGDITGGPVTIHFEGRAGTRYALDGSDNLATWAGIVTNTAVANATQLTDPVPPPTRRYYRVRQVP